MDQTGFHITMNKQIETEDTFTGAFQFHHLIQTVFNVTIIKDFFYHTRVKDVLYPVAKGVHGL